VVHLARDIDLRHWLERGQRWCGAATSSKKKNACANGKANDKGKNEFHQAMVLKG
jgi:hypothetical protein